MNNTIQHITQKLSYKYNGKELQNKYNLNWYDYGARNYDAAVGRFMNLDPLTEKYHTQSPFVYAENNPVLYRDIMGMGSNKNDWRPIINNDGSVEYKPEENDTVETLQEQYDLTEDQANELYYNHRDWDGSISGEAVEAVTGNEILSLNLNNKYLTDKDIVNQTIFGIRHSIINDIKLSNKGIKPDWTLNLNDIFSYISAFTDRNAEGANYGIFTNEPVKININGQIIEIISLSISSATNKLISNVPNGAPVEYNSFVKLSRIEYYHPNAWINRPKKGLKSLRLPTLQFNLKTKYANELYDYLNP